MSYSLHSIYNTVMDWELQWKKGIHPQNTAGSCQSAEETIKYIQDFPAWFLQKADSLRSNKALSLSVNVNLTAITDLLNRLERLPDWSSPKINSNGKQNNSILRFCHC